MTGQLLMQLFLLLATATLVLYFLGNRRKARAKAGVKLGFLLFIAACIWAVLRPDDLTIVANYVGVSRGTDLLLYLLVVAFMFTTLSSYIRFRELNSVTRVSHGQWLYKTPLHPSLTLRKNEKRVFRHH